jgi:hypothetical protein
MAVQVDGAMIDSDNSDAESNSSNSPLASYQDTLARIAELAPAVVVTRNVDTAYLSAAERVLAQSQGRQAPVILKETSLIRFSLGEAFTEAKKAVAPLSSFAYQKFLPPLRLPHVRRGASLIAHEALLPHPIPLSENDVSLIVPDKTPTYSALLTDKQLSEWQESSRRSLEVVSASDALLEVLVVSLCPADQDGGQERPDMDMALVTDVMRFLGQNLRYLANSLSRSYVNALLARRDAVLDVSSLTTSQGRAEARLMPLCNNGLFGNDVTEIVKRYADRTDARPDQNMTSNYLEEAARKQSLKKKDKSGKDKNKHARPKSSPGKLADPPLHKSDSMTQTNIFQA